MDMSSLITPFGEIKILIDGKQIPYSAMEGRKLDVLCPNVLGRYQIAITFIPDGKKHSIACIFEPNCSYKRSPEAGEFLECQSFYNDCRIKMSIGLECEAGYIGGVRVSDRYDYDADYLENGMSYIILSDTKTEHYVFGIAWIDDVGWDDPDPNWDDSVESKHDRDVETWYGADPTLSL